MRKRLLLLVAVMGLVVPLALCGCQTGASGPSDEELIQAKVETFGAGLVEQDVEKILSTLSDDFYHPEAGDKGAVKGFFEQAIDAGYLENAEVSSEDATIEIEEGEATVYPIELSSSAGAVTLELTLAKEEACWMVTGLDIEGL